MKDRDRVGEFLVRHVRIRSLSRPVRHQVAGCEIAPSSRYDGAHARSVVSHVVRGYTNEISNGTFAARRHPEGPGEAHSPIAASRGLSASLLRDHHHHRRRLRRRRAGIVVVIVGKESDAPPPPLPPPWRGLVVISAVAVGGGRDAVAGGRGRGHHHHRGVIVPPLFGRGGWGGRDSLRRGRRRGTRCSQCRDWPLRGRSRNSRSPRAGAA